MIKFVLKNDVNRNYVNVISLLARLKYLFYVQIIYCRWRSSVGSVGGVTQLVVASSLMLKGIGFDPG